MKDQLISYETANLAEKVGYPYQWQVIENENVPMNIPDVFTLSKWLRDKHNIDIAILPLDSNAYRGIIYKDRTEVTRVMYYPVEGIDQDVYSKCLNKALYHALTVI